MRLRLPADVRAAEPPLNSRPEQRLRRDCAPCEGLLLFAQPPPPPATCLIIASPGSCNGAAAVRRGLLARPADARVAQAATRRPVPSILDGRALARTGHQCQHPAGRADEAVPRLLLAPLPVGRRQTGQALKHCRPGLVWSGWPGLACFPTHAAGRSSFLSARLPPASPWPGF